MIAYKSARTPYWDRPRAETAEPVSQVEALIALGYTAIAAEAIMRYVNEEDSDND